MELDTAGTMRSESLALSVCKDQPREIKAQRGKSLAYGHTGHSYQAHGSHLGSAGPY